MTVQSPAHAGSAPVRRRGKIRAILAGCAVLGFGAAVTLAAWTDTEWVFGGGEGDGDPIGTSSFEVQQNLWDGAGGAANFVDRESLPGGQLRFAPGALALTPGDTITAAMQLRTITGSDPGEVTLAGAVANGLDNELFDTVTYAAYTGVSQADCATNTTGAGTVLVATGSPLTTAGGSSFALAGNAAAAIDICFVLTLPANAPDSVQGSTIAPAWEFSAISV